MPNVIINNYCNQKCDFCFAIENMEKSLKKDMSLITFVKALKYLKTINDNNVRILGGEPLLSKNIRNFLLIATKSNFDTIIFSNINIQNEKIKKIFSEIDTKNMRVNCNINSPNFYTKQEWENINQNIKYFQEKKVKVILGYNICDIDKKSDFIFKLGELHGVKAINIKITNSSLGGNLIIDNSKRELGQYIFDVIKRFHSDFFIEVSCGLDKKIFTKKELLFIKNNTSIHLKFGCEGNIGKFDINTDGKIFKCFPLYEAYSKNFISLDVLLKEKWDTKKVLEYLTKNFGNYSSNGECSANKILKNLT